MERRGLPRGLLKAKFSKVLRQPEEGDDEEVEKEEEEVEKEEEAREGKEGEVVDVGMLEKVESGEVRLEVVL